MKRKTLLVVFILFGALILSGCQPKIYGQVKRKKDRKCGCQLYQPDTKEQLYSCLESE
jgi:PBP1b-binding outer membrane lipoprotein LpoB